MHPLARTTRTLSVAVALAVTLGACASYNRMMAGAPALQVGQRLTLTGAEEVPPVNTSATGRAVVTILPTSVSGSIETTGITATAAHIHEGAAGANGPVIVPMVKEGDKFVFPAGAKLTDAQYEAYKAGRLYLNVHSAANPGGEIRAQIRP
jgi:hypothetical protein